MKGLTINKLFKSVTFLFLAAYLFYALTNIYFVPVSVNPKSYYAGYSVFSPRRNSIDRNEHTINFSRLADKCFLDERNSDSTKFIALLIVTFFGFSLFGPTQIFWPVSTRLFYNKQYSYLSLCSFRI